MTLGEFADRNALVLLDQHAMDLEAILSRYRHRPCYCVFVLDTRRGSAWDDTHEAHSFIDENRYAEHYRGYVRVMTEPHDGDRASGKLGTIWIFASQYMKEAAKAAIHFKLRFG